MPAPGVPSKDYTSIKQEPGENFCEFVKRLRTAVGRHVKSEVAQKEIITSLVRVNANEACIHKIEALPPDPKPSLEQMVEVCMEIAPEPIPTPSLKKIPGKASITVAAICQAQAPPRKCFNCGDPSHFIKNCPKPLQKKFNSSGSKSFAGLEERCPCRHQHLQAGNRQ